jgi:hypothetical protein
MTATGLSQTPAPPHPWPCRPAPGDRRMDTCMGYRTRLQARCVFLPCLPNPQLWNGKSRGFVTHAPGLRHSETPLRQETVS